MSNQTVTEKIYSKFKEYDNRRVNRDIVLNFVGRREGDYSTIMGAIMSEPESKEKTEIVSSLEKLKKIVDENIDFGTDLTLGELLTYNCNKDYYIKMANSFIEELEVKPKIELREINYLVRNVNELFTAQDLNIKTFSYKITSTLENSINVCSPIFGEIWNNSILVDRCSIIDLLTTIQEKHKSKERKKLINMIAILLKYNSAMKYKKDTFIISHYKTSTETTGLMTNLYFSVFGKSMSTLVVEPYITEKEFIIYKVEESIKHPILNEFVPVFVVVWR